MYAAGDGEGINNDTARAQPPGQFQARMALVREATLTSIPSVAMEHNKDRDLSQPLLLPLQALITEMQTAQFGSMDMVRALRSKPRALGQLTELVTELQLTASSRSPL